VSNTPDKAAPKRRVRKAQIIAAALSLFSEKGYENTRVDEIAAQAGVNKALIYYHFKSKADVLRRLLEDFFTGIKTIALDAVEANIVAPIRAGDLDILSDRLRFANDEAVSQFLENMGHYRERLLDYILDNRDTVRLMLAQSLKRGRSQMGLFRFVELMEQKESNPLYRTIHDADDDFTFSGAVMVSKFFFGILPLLNLAAYFDDYLRAGALPEDTLRADFLRAYAGIHTYPVSGRDLLLTLDAPIL
jgi:AcrR family transcriptional regulator